MFRGFFVLLASIFLLSPLVLAQEPETPFAQKLVRLVKATLTGELPADYGHHLIAEDKLAGVVRLTDENYDEKVRQGDKDNLWVVMVHDNTPLRGGMDFYEAHANATAAYAKLVGGDFGKEANGKKVIFARMLFDTEWKTCTRWMVFRPPRLVFVTDNGASLRFLSPPQIKSDGTRWANWIKDGTWSKMEQWSGGFAPGGSRSWMPEMYIRYFEVVSPYIPKIPYIAWMFITGAVMKFAMDWLHPATYPKEAHVTNPDAARLRERADKLRAGLKASAAAQSTEQTKASTGSKAKQASGTKKNR